MLDTNYEDSASIAENRSIYETNINNHDLNTTDRDIKNDRHLYGFELINDLKESDLQSKNNYQSIRSANYR